LSEERTETELATSEWQMLGKGETSDLALHKPQMLKVIVQLESVKVNLKRKKLDLERTVIKASFNVLLARKGVDFGQYLNSGLNIGKFYSTEIMEVRLPLSNKELGQLNLNRTNDADNSLQVTFSASYADKRHTWQSTIVRTEGLIDPQGRIIYLTVELKGKQLYLIDDGTLINISQFVKAVIEGRTFNNIFSLTKGGS